MTKSHATSCFAILILGLAVSAQCQEPRPVEGVDGKAVLSFLDQVTSHARRGDDHRLAKRYAHAIAEYDEAIRLYPKYAAAYRGRGTAYLALKAYDKALIDFDEAIQLAPDEADSWTDRGILRYVRKDLDQSIADFDQAVRLSAAGERPFYGRGLAWLDKKEYDRAAADFDQAASQPTRPAKAYYAKAAIALATGRADAIESARRAINADEWRTTCSVYAAIVGGLAARRMDLKADADALLGEAAAKADQSAWPYPIIRHLRNEIDETAMMASATDVDKETEMRCFLAFDQLLNGRDDKARENLRWVRDHGTPTFLEVRLAIAALDRLTGASPRTP